MRRKATNQKGKSEYVDSIWRTYPLFKWVKCENCHDEFRREWVWTAFVAWVKPYWHQIFLCKDCAPDYDSAHDYFHNEKWYWAKKVKAPRPQKQY